jgi:hypothetical protein
MTAQRRPLVANQSVAIALGAAFIVAGAYLLYDAYEARGADRPFALRFLPGG